MSQLQTNLFQYIKSVVPANLSFVDEIANALEISTDSAYRRIRGEKQVSFEEIQKLSNRFRISIDQVLSLKNDLMLFSGNFIEEEQFDFMKYLDQVVYSNLCYIAGFKQKEFFIFCKDIPLFYYYAHPELAAFKFFFWIKTVLMFPSHAQLKFSLKEIHPDFFEKVKTIATVFSKIPANEILNIEATGVTLRQIEYYKDTGVFASTSELELMYAKLHEMVNHMESICEAGKKFMPGQKPNESDASTKMYVNNFAIGDNSYLATLDEKKVCFINHTTVNFMITQDEKFCNYMFLFLQNLIHKSNLISEVGERERTIFFNMFRQRIDMHANNATKRMKEMSPYY